MEPYLQSTDEVIKELNTSLNGLAESETQKRLVENGPNELLKTKKKSIWRRLLEQIIDPMILVLLVAAIVSVVISAVEGGTFKDYVESGIIFAVVALNCILGVVQESKAEKAIEALQQMNAATATVRRNGEVMEIAANELVAGDVVLLEAGDAVPADMRLVVAASLKIEESALTGESVPVDKKIDAIKDEVNSNAKVPLGDRKNMAYMGSSIVYGRGEGVVTSTGMNTEVGKIAKFIHEAHDGQTPLQRKLAQLSKFLCFIVLGICVAVFVIQLVMTGEYTATAIMSSFMLAVALAVAAIPEGLAAVVTIALSIGVTRMAKRNAIVRRLTAVETLGCVQVICSDKTGTLTQNKMTVVEHYGDTALLARGMALCCDCKISPDGTVIGDPTENALVYFAGKQGLDVDELLKQMPRVAEAPFDSVRKLMSTLHKEKSGFIQYTKGATDELLSKCTYALIDGKEVKLTAEIKKSIVQKNKEYANKALRVLACGYRKWTTLPTDISPEKVEKELVFVGLQAMIDPVRPEVLASLESCKTAGIRVVMITGDHKETAVAIANELGLEGEALSSWELDELSDEEFERRIENICVYARVQPEQKVRIVNMWKKKGFVTAMTGDGVNDAPALKSGDIGVGMGITGTDVTKNVADIVLADDNFATIVSAVQEGRRIYDNIQKTIQFLLSTNLSEMLCVLIATLAGIPFFRPIHLLYINLISDTIPAVALSMEPAHPDIMSRKPRNPRESLFADGVGFNIFFQGLLIAGLVMIAFFIIRSFSPESAITAAFFALAMCEFFQAYTLRSIDQSVFKLKKQNVILWWALGGSLLLTLAIIYIPPLASAFSLVPLSLAEVAICSGLGFLVMPIVEITKAIQRMYTRRKHGKYIVMKQLSN